MIVYIALARRMGAEKSYSIEVENRRKELKKIYARHEQERMKEAVMEDKYIATKTSFLQQIYGVSALVSLAFIMLNAFNVWFAGSDYIANFEHFKSIVIYPTLIYFVTASMWISMKDKNNG